MIRAPRPGPERRSGPYDPRTVEIRLGGPRTYAACLAIDDGYTTGRIWQPVTRAFDDPLGGLTLAGTTGAPEDQPFSITFQPLRLPRPVHDPGLYTLRAPALRTAAWEAAGCLLVVRPVPPAAAGEGPGAADPAPDAPGEVWGYVVLNAVAGARLAWIAELAVAPEHRRRGLGRLLLDAAGDWARAPVGAGGGGELGALMIELSPRNYPAIAFCRAGGFRFAGYTDYTPAGGDLRLFFIRPAH
ncbi:MAG TPA: GNAT family N-acetyltransferase [Chloroflexia bacterium]|nr:GNAT family N-acetyltransferase [Chloroflexia bacterium]